MDNLISQYAFEVKNGGRTYDSLSTKVSLLVTLRLNEETSREAYEREQREEDRRASR